MKCKPMAARAARGFTLVEMLVAMAVFGVLLAVAVPSFQSVWTSVRMSAATNEFLGTLRLARTNALSRNRTVVMCVSSDAQRCDSRADWHAGWMVFVDDNQNGVRDGESEQVILTRGALDGVRIIGNSTVRSFISWHSNGTMRRGTGQGVPQMGTVTLCAQSSAAAARQIVVNIGGRARVQTVAGEAPKACAN